MAEDNETVAEIKYRIYSHWRGCENCSLEEMNGADLIAIADQFEAAHNREIAENDERYLKCREELAATRERRDECEVKMRKAFERVTKAEQKLAANDAEIAELRECLKEAVELMTLGKPTIEGIARWRKALGGANDDR